MNAIFEVTFCGRRFTAQEVELMRVVARDYAGLGVTEIARTICELLEWTRPNGALKNHECRQLLERLTGRGSADASRSPQVGRARASASESISAALRT